MKGSKITGFIGVLLFAAAALTAGVSWVQWQIHFPAENPTDLNVRWNESRCAHEGVNPFKVFNREIEHERYKGIARPDMPKDETPGKARVHAYPPWHVVYTWFYGELSFGYVAAIMYFIYGISAFFVVRRLDLLVSGDNKFLFWGIIAALAAAPLVSALYVGNYGLLLGALLMLFIIAEEKGHQIIVGLLWALIMSKPQVGVLLVFPLLFRKRYIAIGVAVSVCVLSTFWLANVYGESALSLILQIPKIGAPFVAEAGRGPYWLRFLPEWCALPVKNSIMLASIVGCGWLSWRFRNAKEWFVRYAPYAFFFPLWTYSQSHDRLAAFPFIALLALVLIDMLRNGSCRKIVAAMLIAMACEMFFSATWGILASKEVFNAAGKGWIYVGLTYPFHIVWFAFSVFVLVRGPKILFADKEDTLRI